MRAGYVGMSVAHRAHEIEIWPTQYFAEVVAERAAPRAHLRVAPRVRITSTLHDLSL